jgi:hypothetical protein
MHVKSFTKPIWQYGKPPGHQPPVLLVLGQGLTMQTEFLNLYGPNLLTVRAAFLDYVFETLNCWLTRSKVKTKLERITGVTQHQPSRRRNSALVWEESIRQMTEMLHHWRISGSSEKFKVSL